MSSLYEVYSVAEKEVLKRHHWFLKAQWVLYNISSITAVTVTVMFWALLVPSGECKNKLKPLYQ